MICSTKQENYWNLVCYDHFLFCHSTSCPSSCKGQQWMLWFVPLLLPTERNGIKWALSVFSSVRLSPSHIQAPVIMQLIKHNDFETSLSSANRFRNAKVTAGRRGTHHRLNLTSSESWAGCEVQSGMEQLNAFRGGYSIPLEFYVGKLLWTDRHRKKTNHQTKQKLKILTLICLKCGRSWQLCSSIRERHSPHTSGRVIFRDNQLHHSHSNQQM